ncbi:MAG: hypothetical protein GF346_09200 [Candidatus Eisenbacteria bacterium]|nr:hypothetical protein [Candidatus Latescibacterota bacterium]MBD3302607.1 hypothetical protein [Candidatus Eisenbacteria bacterium]
MIRSVCAAGLALLLGVSLAWADGKWLHIRVDEGGEDGERVRVNLPLELVSEILPLVEADEFHRGKVRFDHTDFDEVDVRGILAAVRDAEDGEYITVEGAGENVKIRKQGNLLSIDVDEDDEKVRIRVRMEVLDALISGQENELDIAAAIGVLGEKAHGDLVTVESDRESVRIWIDDKNEAD